MAVVTPTDRPKWIRNHCVIEVLVAFLVLSRWFLDFSVGVGAFVIGLSQISSFFSYIWMGNPVLATPNNASSSLCLSYPRNHIIGSILV